MRALISVAVAIVLSVAWRPALAAEPLERLVRKVMEQTWPLGQAPAASGFFVDPAGLVLTNAHAVAGCRQILAGPKGAAAPATLLAMDATTDTALIRAPKPAPATLPLSRGAASVGQKVQIAGLHYSAGTASNVRLTAETGGVEPAGRVDLLKLLQLDGPLADGSSGSPVMNDAGVVVAMIVGRLNAGEGKAVAMPSARLIRFLQFNGVTPGSPGKAPLSAARITSAVAEVRCQ